MPSDDFIEVDLGPLCAKIGSGATPRGGKKVYLDRGDVSLIRSQNVYNDGFSINGLVYLAEQHVAQLSNVAVETDDVLLNITGDSVARCCQVDARVLPARVNQHVAIIRPRSDELDPGFLRYFLISPRMQLRMLNWAHAGATRKALTKGMIEAFKIPKPELSTQRRIAGILGSLDDKIELNRRMSRTLEGMAQALFKSWFIDFDPVHYNIQLQQEGAAYARMGRAARFGSFGEDISIIDERGRRRPLRSEDIHRNVCHLFPIAFEDSPLGPIPEGWEVRPLTEAISINPKRTLVKGTLAPFLEMSNMPTRGPSPDTWRLREMTSGMKFVNGDTLVARITPCLENGKTAFVDFLRDDQVGWGSTEYIILRPKGEIPPIFAYLLARTPSFRSFAIRQMTGSSGRQRVPPQSLSKFQLALPELDSSVYRVLGDITQPFFNRIGLAMRQNRTLASLRDTLLPKLLSGEIEVPEAETVIEEAV